MIRRVLLALFLLFWFVAPPARAEFRITPQSFRLENGLEVVVVHQPLVPAINHILWYKVGAADDPLGKTGLAHYSEHMMFKGTSTFPDLSISREIAKLGGDDNAFTSYDFTAYTMIIGKQHLARAMELEADRMQHLAFAPQDATRERDVVAEERASRVETNVDALLHEQMMLQLFQRHPYRRPIGGWPADIASLTRQDVMDFYQRYYTPSNAVLILVGDITLEEAKPLVEKYYGAVPKRAAPPRRWASEPTLVVPRTVDMTHPLAQKRLWYGAWQVPSLTQAQQENQRAKTPYTLEVLAYLLGAEKVGRLYTGLITDEALTSDINVSYQMINRGPSSFLITTHPLAETEFDTVSGKIEAVLQQILDEGVPDAELEQAKQTLKAWEIYQYEGLRSMAYRVGMAVTAGLEIGVLEEYDAAIDAVTAADIQEAIRAYLMPNRRVTGLLAPENTLAGEAP